MDLESARDGAADKWTSDDTDKWSNDYSTEIRVLYPGLVRRATQDIQEAAAKAGKRGDSQVRIMDWIGVMGTVDLIQSLLPDLDVIATLPSYSFVRDTLARFVTFDKKSLTFAWKSDAHPGFVRDHVRSLCEHKMSVTGFYEALDKWIDDQTFARKYAGKSEAEVLALKVKAEARAVAAKDTKLRLATDKALTESLDKALSGVLTDDRVKTIVSEISKSHNVNLFPPPKSVGADPSTFDVKEFQALITNMATAGRLEEIRKITKYASLVESVYAASEAATPKLAIAV
jgi:hypothetical protein